MWRFLFAVAFAAFTNPFVALAQTPAQFERLNRVAQFLVTSPICERLGMTLDADLATKAAGALKAESETWRIDAKQFDQLASEAIRRQSAVFGIDLVSTSKGAKSEAQLRDVRKIFVAYGRTCMAANADPIFAPLIKLPSGFDLDKAATEAADILLEGGGLASWQTPLVQARGDLMMAAGTCRRHIGAARSDKIFRTYSSTADPRERAYYVQSFDDGLADKELDFDAAQCERLIARLQKKAETKP